MAHPTTVRGPIEEEYGLLREAAMATRDASVADAETTYRAAIDTIEGDRRAALRAAGFGPNGEYNADNWPPSEAVVPVAPVNVVLPVISGTAEIGQTLSVNNGSWQYADTYTYQWMRTGDVAITDETNNTYLLQSGDESDEIWCVVTAHNETGDTDAASATVSPTAP